MDQCLEFNWYRSKMFGHCIFGSSRNAVYCAKCWQTTSRMLIKCKNLLHVKMPRFSNTCFILNITICSGDCLTNHKIWPTFGKCSHQRLNEYILQQDFCRILVDDYFFWSIFVSILNQLSDDWPKMTIDAMTQRIFLFRVLM